MKTCSKCRNPKDGTEFYKHSGRKDGLANQCKQCHEEYRNSHAMEIKIERDSRKEKTKLYNSEYRQGHKEEASSYAAAYYRENMEDRKEYRAKHYDQNHDEYIANSAKRRAAKLQRTPSWLTKEHLLEIREFYSLCKELQWLSDPSDPLTIDHIIPLQGDNVSGLHVPWNLQILPRSLNCSKGNK
jgi:hypothetical protein